MSNLKPDPGHYCFSLPFASSGQAKEVVSSNEDQESNIMQKLEDAIASGNHKDAALLAKEVTKLQISTKLSLKELTEKKANNIKVEKIK